MNAPAQAVRAEEDAALAAAMAAASAGSIDLATYTSQREGERDGENAAGAVDVLASIPIERPGFARRIVSRLFGPPPVSQTELAVRLLSAWTLGKPSSADEVNVGLAVLTVRQIVTLTGGR